MGVVDLGRFAGRNYAESEKIIASCRNGVTQRQHSSAQAPALPGVNAVGQMWRSSSQPHREGHRSGIKFFVLLAARKAF